MRIIVIDDNKELLLLTAAMLKRAGYETVASLTTRGIIPEKGDIVLSDVDRPGDPDLVNPNNCPIIWMSRDENNKPHLLKPFNKEALFEMIKKLT